MDSPLTFISIKANRAEGHTRVCLLVVKEPTATRQALCRAPAQAGLTSFMAASTASCCCVPKVAQGALAHTLPVGPRAGEGLSVLVPSRVHPVWLLHGLRLHSWVGKMPRTQDPGIRLSQKQVPICLLTGWGMGRCPGYKQAGLKNRNSIPQAGSGGSQV